MLFGEGFEIGLNARDRFPRRFDLGSQGFGRELLDGGTDVEQNSRFDVGVDFRELGCALIDNVPVDGAADVRQLQRFVQQCGLANVMAADDQLVPRHESQLLEQRQLRDKTLIADQSLSQRDEPDDRRRRDASERTKKPNTNFTIRHERAFRSVLMLTGYLGGNHSRSDERSSLGK